MPYQKQSAAHTQVYHLIISAVFKRPYLKITRVLPLNLPVPAFFSNTPPNQGVEDFRFAPKRASDICVLAMEAYDALEAEARADLGGSWRQHCGSKDLLHSILHRNHRIGLRENLDAYRKAIGLG